MPLQKAVEGQTIQVTEQDFLAALAQELAPLERKPYEFTLSEIMAAIEKTMPTGKSITRSSVRARLMEMVKEKRLAERIGYFDTDFDQGRRKQWAYTILNVDVKPPEELFPFSLFPKPEPEAKP